MYEISVVIPSLLSTSPYHKMCDCSVFGCHAQECVLLKFAWRWSVNCLVARRYSGLLQDDNLPRGKTPDSLAAARQVVFLQRNATQSSWMMMSKKMIDRDDVLILVLLLFSLLTACPQLFEQHGCAVFLFLSLVLSSDFRLSFGRVCLDAWSSTTDRRIRR